MIYAGAGSNETPKSILNLMTEIGMYFGRHGITLRSGGNTGAESAFEQGADAVGGPKQIFRVPEIKMMIDNATPAAIIANRFAVQYLPVDNELKMWNVSQPINSVLLAKISMELMGPSLQSPTSLIICWTRDNEIDPNIGQLLTVANQLNESRENDNVFPVLNLNLESNRIAVNNTMRGSSPIGLIDYAQAITSKQYRKGLFR